MTKAEGAVQDSTEFVLLLGKTKTLAPDNEKVVYILCNTIDGSFLHWNLCDISATKFVELCSLFLFLLRAGRRMAQ